MRLFILNVLTFCSVLVLVTSVTNYVPNYYPSGMYGMNTYAPNNYYKKMPMPYKKDKGPDIHIHKHFHNVNIVIWVFLLIILSIFINPKKNNIVIVNKKSRPVHSSSHSSDSSSDSYSRGDSYGGPYWDN